MNFSIRQLSISLFVIIILITIFHSILKSGDFTNAIVAITIAGYFWLFTGTDKTELFFYHSSRYKLRRDISKVIKEYEKNKSFDNLTVKIKKIIKNYFRKRVLSEKFIDSANKEECFALMIALQSEDKYFKTTDTLDLEYFKKIAQNAAQLESYREALLIESLKGIKHYIKDNKLILDNKRYCIGDELKSQSDYKFNQKLLKANQDELVIFSTTSQISSDIIKIITHHNKNLEKVSFFICSPFTRRHQAIKNMSTEYQNPKFSTPISQFIEDNNGTINPKLDTVRRVLKITSSIKNIVNITSREKINLDLFLFKETYPGIKIKMILKQCYVQLQPGTLSYANNLYRFGIDSDSADIFQKILTSIDSYKNNNKLIEPLKTNTFNIKKFETDVISELCLWLFENGVTHYDIISHKEKLNTSIDDEASNYWLDLIASTLFTSRIEVKKNLLTAQNYINDISEIKSDSRHKEGLFQGLKETGSEFHITVAILFKNKDKYLFIKKSDPAYNKNYSLVAGHLENNETPLMAIQREVKEELNIIVKYPQLLQKEANINETCRYGINIHDWYIFTSEQIEIGQKITPDKSEIENIEWMTIEDIKMNKKEFTKGAFFILDKMGFFND